MFNMEDVPWSAPRIVGTRFGPRRIRTWNIPRGSPFWDLWKAVNLKEQGYSVGLWQETWVLTEWRERDGSQSDATRNATAAAGQSDAMRHRNEQAEPQLTAVLADRFREVEEIYERILQETGNDYRYQYPSIKRLSLAIEAYDGGLDASDTGIGKTPVACAVAKTLGRRLFVICPKAVIPPWYRMAYMFDVEIDIINYEMLRTGKTIYGHWEDANRTKFSYAVDQDSTLFVFDECHRMKDDRTLNCGMGVSAVVNEYKVLALSATAADNPTHMKFVGLLTGLIRHPAHFHGWMTQNGVARVRRGANRWVNEFVGGHATLARLHRQIFPVRGSRIKIADLGDRFPSTRIISEPYDMGNGVAAQIQEIYKAMRKEIARLEAAKAQDKGANILTEILRARQRVELLKVPTFVSMARDGLAEAMSVIIIVNFDATVRALALRLQCEYTITGSDSGDRRQRLIDEFNRDEVHLVIMNIRAGGLGISLHGFKRGRTRLVLISPTHSGIDMKQALGRAQRAGGAYSIQKILWAADTVEEGVCKRAKERLERMAMLNDGEFSEILKI